MNAATGKGRDMHAEMRRHEFEPKIIAFVCTWCTYAGADLAGTSRMQYPANVRVLKFPCTGRIDPVFILKAFQQGADGVLVSGCHPGDCHYISGNYHARRRFAVFRRLLDFMGVDLNRLQFSWVSAAEGGKWVEVVTELTERVRAMGPMKEFKDLGLEEHWSGAVDTKELKEVYQAI
jgi:F420-non-reducing hydrogenase iron-sulfur subunit